MTARQEDLLDLGAQTELWHAQAQLARSAADVLAALRVLVFLVVGILVVGILGAGTGVLLALYVRHLLRT